MLLRRRRFSQALHSHGKTARHAKLNHSDDDPVRFRAVFPCDGTPTGPGGRRAQTILALIDCFTDRPGGAGGVRPGRLCETAVAALRRSGRGGGASVGQSRDRGEGVARSLPSGQSYYRPVTQSETDRSAQRTMNGPLLCAEQPMDPAARSLAHNDAVIFRDDRVLESLLRTEHSYMPGGSYFQTTQNDIQPYMRKMVTSWMLEVCEEFGCEDQIFPLAVNYLDRFLCLRRICRGQLQLLAAVCLLLASKIRQCRALSLAQLVYLTDYSVTEQQLKEFELALLHRLNWDLNSVTSFDFVEQLLSRLALKSNARLIRRHAHTFIALCTTEVEFLETRPSLVAGASVCAAVAGMKLASAEETVPQVAACLRLEPDQVRRLMSRIEEMVQSEMASAQVNAVTAGAKHAVSAASKQQPQPAEEECCQPETPTDIQDILF
ncbi:G1/S-specific cyclin-D1 [Amphibalanus amphitrite]|uniref:G1/S-specific cyclin-D1 n=1 Tax=Amphibalanus amphitrite TaxID=1232801 RepID=A0A6A4W034_AMPAM|nr:G1/S-specific cyclin-D1 [Amphibalanus amphitrite]